MMNLRMRVLYELSRRRMQSAPTRQVDRDAYGAWRMESLSRSLAAFDDAHLAGKDVLDFGCGDGQLGQFVALERHPHRVVGVDVDDAALARARVGFSAIRVPAGITVEYAAAKATSIPVSDASFDTILAFDCLEHIMATAPVLREWHRVLRPGGRCLIEWFPFKGPWGPHMEALIPIPWANVLFGQRAMFRVAEKIYDLPEFVPRHWDLDEAGRKKPNKWRAWSTFREQGYVNELDVPTFCRMARNAGFGIARLELHSFSGSSVRRRVGAALMRLPIVGEHFVSYAIVELERPIT